MCPFCLATVAWIAVGATATGGLSALAVSTFRGKSQEATDNRNRPDTHG
jgi:hypothetical protein